MFVITLSDIFGLGLLGIAIIFGIFVFISKISESVKDNKANVKKDDGQNRKVYNYDYDPRGVAIAIIFIIIVFIIAELVKNNPLLMRRGGYF